MAVKAMADPLDGLGAQRFVYIAVYILTHNGDRFSLGGRLLLAR